ncbi:glutathione S-transferase [Mycobacterium asiaticum]|uniref:Glutathione S-transferase n=1 Tax=Mycobacterium asiaticum TaxID=1790 RepID=A0A1A3P124_MYCAS|nr:DUF952 domain-containing protein [Mycobacterium asiaticum]OBK27881.1 glutathione S-transferase [Mycobacterium asiaticum]
MPTTSDLLVRLCSEQEWSSARGTGWIQPDPDESGSAEFVHLSTIEQVHLPANRLYRGRRDMVLLYVDSAELGAPLRWEPGVPTDPDSMRFPHLYGPLPVAAVRKAVGYQPAADGSFSALLDGQDTT